MKFLKIKKTKSFNLKWFNKKNIDLVDDKIELFISKLLDNEDYIEINRKFSKLTIELTSTLNSDQLKILREYQNAELQITSYQTALAYYLGLNEDVKLK